MSLYDAQQWPLVGHQIAVKQITLALNKGRSRHAYLVSGPPSVGKTTFARGLTMAFNCEAESGRPCGTCRPCRLIGQDKHPDVVILQSERVGSQLKIDQVRDLQRLLALQPFEAKNRVAVILRFHEANDAAANALLKTLEEPASRARLILTTDDINLLLPTILSRCQHIPLHPLPVQTVSDALTQDHDLSSEAAASLARLSGGRLGWAINSLQDAESVSDYKSQIADLEILLGQAFYQRFSLAEKIAKQQKDTLHERLSVWTAYWRDVFMIANGTDAWVLNVDRLQNLRQLATTIGPGEARLCLEATRQTQHYISKNVNARMAMDSLILQYPIVTLDIPPTTTQDA